MVFTDQDGHTYPAPKHIHEVDGHEIVTWERDVTSANILTVEAGTNGFRGATPGTAPVPLCVSRTPPAPTFVAVWNRTASDI